MEQETRTFIKIIARVANSMNSTAEIDVAGAEYVLVREGMTEQDIKFVEMYLDKLIEKRLEAILARTVWR